MEPSSALEGGVRRDSPPLSDARERETGAGPSWDLCSSLDSLIRQNRKEL